MERLEKHQQDYKSKAYENYSFQELGNIISFFAKRAGHRNPLKIEKVEKDLYDAKNYLVMMKLKLEETCKNLGFNLDNL